MSKLVLGGGLSGLSAAYYLSKKLSPQQIFLIESSDRLGGWVKSNIVKDGIVFEEGARTIRPKGETGANTLKLIEELGLSSDVVPILSSHPAARNRMIYANGKLHLLPSSIGSLFKTQPPLSRPLISYLMKDLFVNKKSLRDDSIYNFVKRRFGKDIARYLISPMICGICAGNAKEISVNFIMKQLFDYEQQYGSISKGMVKNYFNKKSSIELCNLAVRAKQERWNVYSLKGGLERLPKALKEDARRKGIQINENTACKSLDFRDKEVVAQLDSGRIIKANHIISSIPAIKLAKLVEKQHPILSGLLDKIKNVTVGVVNLNFKGSLQLQPGFGFLVPPKEKLPILGVIYDSCCFPVEENTVVTVMMGGYWFEKYFGKNPDPEFLLKTAKEQLRAILGTKEEPVQYKVNILKECIPQYVVGHNENLEKINNYIIDNKLLLSLCGASYNGVGINDVILSAKNASEKLVG